MRLCKLFILFSIGFSGITSGFAQDRAWIVLERGKAALEQRNLSEALDYCLDAVELQNGYPEAEYWLGRVYQAQGQNILAEEQYRRALELAIYLRVPEDRFIIEYDLAALLRNAGTDRIAEAEAILMSIAARTNESVETSINLDHRYVSLVSDKGLDELLYLYRDDLGPALRARRELAEISWESGRYRSALLHSLRASMSMLSTAGDYIRDRDSSWRFDIDPVLDKQFPDRDVRYPGGSDGTRDLLERALSYETLSDWLDNEGLWPSLYLLGSALYAEGFPESARLIWTLLVEESSDNESPSGRIQAGRWGRYAVAQLDEPFISSDNLQP